MTSSTSSGLLAAAAYQRPRTLYCYGQQNDLQRALSAGEFRLRVSAPQAPAASTQIRPFGPRPAAMAAYLTLSLSSRWDESRFQHAADTDACLVINNVEEFGERLHHAVQRVLPSWAGIDAAVSYGTPSPLGAAFSKAKSLATESEWLFAWRPTQPELSFHPVVVHIGSIESIAELRVREP